ncbi:disintegrin and metalloproteinase domain-containing protein 10-like [Acanthaster planci]|uniref:ADAM10 endopeptidase n=1 Tax=Acanthaster planci TaxID=133434 RepID=A0A8B7ZWT1_ACAPL|nr:disintegrin and metalloproteinase domain-containing protein 10-like [Acanthaster planci]
MLLRCLLLAVSIPAVIYAERLGRFIKHYDTLSYDSNELHLKHERARRSTSAESSVHLDFTAHGRDFKLRLIRGAPHLSPNLIVETTDGARFHEPDYLYVGQLEGEPNTKCHGSILKGLFSGTIYADGDTYHVEPAHRHFDKPTEFHSVIYKGSDVEHPPDGGCGLTSKTMKWMKKVQESAVEEDSREYVKKGSTRQSGQTAHDYSPRENIYADPKHRRTRRQTPLKNTCNLYLQADHTYSAFFNHEDSEVIAQFNNFVAAVNAIYGAYKLGTYNDVGFLVDRIRINGTSEKADPTNPFRFENIGVEKFLDLNSLQNHDEYCLAYVFANRDFNDGVLGLAWVGSSGSTSGGICERYKQFSSGYQSLNTGIVTIKNYGSQVPTKVTEITFAHEIGHNFGSPHDYPDACRPGDFSNTRSQGNYIMYASATSGDKPNNKKFSDCSIANMSNVVNAKASRCFVSSDRPVCGNHILNENEECDCGYDDQCTDRCCNARQSAKSASEDVNACKLATNGGVKAVCSKSQGPCCNEATCNYHAANSKTCKPETDCSEESECDGMSASCPEPSHKVDLSSCNNFKQVCKSGECSGSVCEVFGLTECYCPPPAEGETDEGCHLCCQNGDDVNTCMSSTKIPAMANFTAMHGEVIPGSDSTEKILYQVPGAPCNELKGYCDVFYKCRNVDSNGPLSRLRDAILNPQLYKDIAEWLKTNWWAAVLIGLAVILFMALFIKVCSVHTPSSNPKLPKHRQLTLPRRPSSRQRGGGRPIEMA